MELLLMDKHGIIHRPKDLKVKSILKDRSLIGILKGLINDFKYKYYGTWKQIRKHRTDSGRNKTGSR